MCLLLLLFWLLLWFLVLRLSAGVFIGVSSVLLLLVLLCLILFIFVFLVSLLIWLLNGSCWNSGWSISLPPSCFCITTYSQHNLRIKSLLLTGSTSPLIPIFTPITPIIPRLTLPHPIISASPLRINLLILIIKILKLFDCGL